MAALGDLGAAGAQGAEGPAVSWEIYLVWGVGLLLGWTLGARAVHRIRVWRRERQMLDNIRKRYGGRR